MLRWWKALMVLVGLSLIVLCLVWVPSCCVSSTPDLLDR